MTIPSFMGGLYSCGELVAQGGEYVEKFAFEAAGEDSQVLCFPELFNGPFFAQVENREWYKFAEAIPADRR